MKFSLLRGRVFAICFVGAILAALAIASYFELFEAGTPLFFACFFLFATNSSYKTTRRERVVFILFSLLFASMRVVGRSFDLYNSHVLIMKNSVFFFRAASAMVALFCCSFSVCRFAYVFLRQLLSPAPIREQEEPEGLFFLSMAFVLFLGSIPYLLLYAPGLNIADTRDQILQFFGFSSYIGDGSILTDHHPVLTTLIYGGFMRLGLVFGSANMGQLLYSFTSLFAVSLTFAYLLLVLSRLGMRRNIARGIAVVYALWPVPALYSFNMGKDSTVIPFVLLFAAQMVFLFFSDEYPNARFYAGLAINIFFLMALRKSASYCLLFTLLLALPYLQGRRKGMIVAFLSAFLFFCGYGILLSQLGVIPGETREILSVPLQQAARALRDEEVSETDKENLACFMELETAAAVYDPRLSDPVKDRTNSDASIENILSFAKGWVSVGMKNPSCYFQAWMNIIYGYFYPSNSNTILCLTLNSPEIENLTLSQDSALSGVRLVFHNFIYFRMRRIPILSALFFVSGIVFAFLFLFCALWASRGFYAAVPFGFFLFTLGVAMLSPKSGEIRYVLPLMYALPAMLGALSLPSKEVRT